MKAKDVQIGGTYMAKVSGKLTSVTLLQTSSYGGWDALNEATGKRVRIKTAARLRRPVASPNDDNRWDRYANETEDYGGVLGADGCIYSDADPGL